MLLASTIRPIMRLWLLVLAAFLGTALCMNACTNTLQSNVFFIADALNNDGNPGQEKLQYKQVQAVKAIEAGFGVGIGINGALLNGCYDETYDHQLDGQSLVNAVYFSYNPTKGQTLVSPNSIYISFCLPYASNGYTKTLNALDNTDNFGDSVNYTQSMVDQVSGYLNNNCTCSRMANKSTQKYTVWIARQQPDSTIDVTGITATPYVHFILAFGFTVSDGSFHDKIAAQMASKYDANYPKSFFIINNADKVTDIQGTLATKMCSLAGVPSQGAALEVRAARHQ